MLAVCGPPNSPLSARGASLIELVLVVGVVMAVTAGVFATYRLADRSAARREADGAAQVIELVRRANELPLGHYTAIASTPLDLAPPHLVDNGALRSRWGRITLRAEDVQGRRNAGFSVRYVGVPADQCQNFVRGLPAGSRQITVGLTVVSGQAGLNRPVLARACSSALAVDVTYHHFTGASGDPRLRPR